MKKYFSQDYSFGEHYYVVKIMSQLFDYQLVLFLNNYMKVNFRKFPELMVYNPKKTESVPHSLYNWSSSNAIGYFLVASLEKSNTLSSETFLLIEKREQRETVDRFIEKISSFEFVFSIEEITLIALPSKIPKQQQFIEYLNNISIDLEQHLGKLKKDLKNYPQKKK